MLFLLTTEQPYIYQAENLLEKVDEIFFYFISLNIEMRSVHA